MGNRPIACGVFILDKKIDKAKDYFVDKIAQEYLKGNDITRYSTHCLMLNIDIAEITNKVKEIQDGV